MSFSSYCTSIVGFTYSVLWNILHCSRILILVQPTIETLTPSLPHRKTANVFWLPAWIDNDNPRESTKSIRIHGDNPHLEKLADRFGPIWQTRFLAVNPSRKQQQICLNLSKSTKKQIGLMESVLTAVFLCFCSVLQMDLAVCNTNSRQL